MKVLILDVDGVLNNSNTPDRFEGCLGLDEDKLILLRNIVEKTACKIVLSSSWRHYENFKEYLLKQSQLREQFIGDTEEDYNRYKNRGEEIQAWLDVNKVDTFVILDDDHLEHLKGFGKNFVQTNEDVGLTKEIAERCIKLLNGE